MINHNEVLTLNMLKEMEPRSIFATGTAFDTPRDININGSGRALRWVAVRGGIHDWAIYVNFSGSTQEYIRDCGDKICSEDNIKKLVKCDEEAFKMYRY